MEQPRSHIITFRNALLSGALLMAPLVVTVWAIRQVIMILGGTIRPYFYPLVPQRLQQVPFLWDIIGTIVIVLLLALLGYVSQYVFGKLFVDVTDRFIRGIPGVGMVYNSLKQIIDTFGTQQRNVFSKVVMLQFPREGLWSVGFLTNKNPAELSGRIGEEVWTVFIPTTPNPTSGFLVALPRQQVVELDMSVGEGMKMIISGGAVAPAWTGHAAVK